MLPTKIKKFNRVKSIHQFGNSSFAVMNNGTVYAWGSNNRGQLGLASGEQAVLVPTIVPNLTNITTVASGTWHTLALDSTGRVFTAGSAKNGELGRQG